MLIVNHAYNASIVFTDNNITYIGPFVILCRSVDYIKMMYKGWCFVFTVYNHSIWVKYRIYQPAYSVIITPNNGIQTLDRIYDMCIYYKCPINRAAFNINFICGGLRRDVFVYELLKCSYQIDYQLIVDWLAHL